jgi:hypothetical protein
MQGCVNGRRVRGSSQYISSGFARIIGFSDPAMTGVVRTHVRMADRIAAQAAINSLVQNLDDSDDVLNGKEAYRDG